MPRISQALVVLAAVALVILAIVVLTLPAAESAENGLGSPSAVVSCTDDPSPYPDPPPYPGPDPEDALCTYLPLVVGEPFVPETTTALPLILRQSAAPESNSSK